jgi:hypothetical protein
MASMTFDVFWEYISKAFNTKYHEGTKDKNWNFQNKFNPKNVCCPTNTVPLLKQYRQNQKKTSDMISARSILIWPLIPFNHWKLL